MNMKKYLFVVFYLDGEIEFFVDSKSGFLNEMSRLKNLGVKLKWKICRNFSN